MDEIRSLVLKCVDLDAKLDQMLESQKALNWRVQETVDALTTAEFELRRKVGERGLVDGMRPDCVIEVNGYSYLVRSPSKDGEHLVRPINVMKEG